MKEYNETKNLKTFLAGLGIIAMAEHSIPELAKKINVKRSGVYRLLSEE